MCVLEQHDSGGAKIIACKTKSKRRVAIAVYMYIGFCVCMLVLIVQLGMKFEVYFC